MVRMRFASATVVGALVVSGTVAGAQPVSPPTETGETTLAEYAAWRKTQQQR